MFAKAYTAHSEAYMADWFGLNWLDILLGIVILAFIPFLFAAYGGHLATEPIEDPKRKRNIKLQFWGLFVIGVALASWQQIRAAINDKEHEIKATWLEGLLLSEARTIPVPPFWDVKTGQPRHEEKPDIGLQVVSLDLPALELINRTGAILDSPSYSPVIWNLDNRVRQGEAGLASIPTSAGTQAFLRPHSTVGPMSLFGQPERDIKPGDRLFGVIQVTCPRCVAVRQYWVYAVRGKGGWYSEANGLVSIPKLAPLIPGIAKNPEQFLKDIPEAKRIQIKEPTD
jgi:hypothetical protein